MNVYVINEYDPEARENVIIGVASSPDKALEMLPKYYGQYKELSFTDIRDSGLEWRRELEVYDLHGNPYKVYVSLEWYTVDAI